MRRLPLLLIVFVAGVGAESATGACPNEATRLAQGSQHLPDCRAYELVTPGDRLTTNSYPGQASERGDALTYYSVAPTSRAESSSFFHLARRDASRGWATEGVGPQIEPGARQEGVCEQNVFFSPSLHRHTYEQGWYDPADPLLCKRSDELVPGEPFPHRNVHLFTPGESVPQLVNATAPDAIPANAKFEVGSDDFSRIVFSTEARLTPDAPAARNFYIWEAGTIRLVTRLPNGAAAVGELVEAAGHRASSGDYIPGSGMAPVTGALSGDGDRILFYAGDGLFSRLNPGEPQSAIESGQCTEPQRACTVRVDASQGPDPDGGGVFWRASDDGRTVLFTSERRLTGDSTAQPGRADLYRYDVESGELEDLTISAGEPADVRGVSDAAEDARIAYFVANGVLAPGATPGNCRDHADAAQRCNLYLLRDDDSISFVARLSRDDRPVWQEGGVAVERRKTDTVRATASRSGQFLAFTSMQSLTGYDNRQVTSGTPLRQIFLFDAEGAGGAGELRCASCIPDGTRPSDSTIAVMLGRNYGPGGQGSHPHWRVRHVLDDGRVFFDSREALVARDTNEARDVYQFRAGKLDLITTGEHPSEARFLDASRSGSDVFFRTGQSLVPADTDNEGPSLYGARVGGGFPEAHRSDPACEEEACRPVEVLPPPLIAPGSTAVVRAPQARRPAKRRARPRSRCKRGKPRQIRKCKRRKRLRLGIQHRRAVRVRKAIR